jgi:hypothetical protein
MEGEIRFELMSSPYFALHIDMTSTTNAQLAFKSFNLMPEPSSSAA